ncbi:C45 family autoproteolytic acyltransferase/hydolase [Leptolyngbya sp. 7M]|uniref:C45 family autoproteolytic acyltransferase/hydolase n=1 Tax=Leptolyngbya sp. 7M TaxID=2812896 RepID=UPI001CED1FFA|nr:C45 family peptidase [Leptolyngbya sp. 7M]
MELQASAAENLCTCDPDSATEVVLPPAPTISPDQIAQFLPPNWRPVAPHRQDYGVIKVVWLQGSPYEMGYQHGQYLHDEIASLGSDIISTLRFAGRGLALGRLSALRSYPEKVEECRGLADATQDIGMTMDACLVLAYGDVYQEIFASTLPDILFWDGCSQWVATGEATVDGRLYHGSTLDNDQKPINYIIYNPVVFIRQPNDGLPHVFITYPGVVWPNWGLNIAGITLGLDTVHPGPGELSMHGRSNVQILGQVLKTATSFAEARQIMETQPRVHADLVMITDGKSKQAGVFEFTGRNLGVRELQENDVLYVTNHIVLEEMFDRQRFPISESSLTRFRRFSQLMEPDGISSLYGTLDAAGMVRIGRDRVNPDTLEASPLDLFDDDASPGGNGSLRQ